MVCTAATIFLMQPVPHWSMARHVLPQGGSLVFFSTFEPISLTPDSCMQRNGIPMVYERAASQLPTLYVCPVENVLGQVTQVPLLPYCLKGNFHNTIPYSLRHIVPAGAAADSNFQARQRDGQQTFRGQHLDVALWEVFPRTISV